MEGHQVTWNPNVPYEDLVKQCPFLSQRASLPLENSIGDNVKIPELQLSKSKKKRLKKRLKAISQNNKNSISEELPPSTEPNQTEMSSKGKNASVSEAKKDQKTEKPKKVSDVVDGEISVPHPKVIRENVFVAGENKSKIKPNKKHISQVDSELNVKQEKSHITNSSAKVIPTVSKHVGVSKAHNEISQLKKQDTASDITKDKSSSGVSREEICDTNEKSRDEVLSEREAKKKAKQLAKQKKIDKSQGATSDNSSLELEKRGDIHTENVQKQVLLEVVHSKSVVTDEKSSENINQNKIGDGNEKSRDNVIAEREAKKKAKQLAKQKKTEKNLEKLPDKDSETVKSEVLVIDKESVLKTGTLKDDNTSGENKVEGEKSKSQLRAERRAKQEAQRAAKEAEKKQKLASIENKENKILKQVDKPVVIKEVKELKGSSKSKVVSQQRIKLFSHLHLAQRPSQTQLIPNVHPSVLELGIKYSSQIINGSNSRCVALLNCLKEVIHDYSTPAEKEFSRGLESKLGELTNYLNQCRPLAVSMTNALRHIKSHLTQLPNNVSDDEAKRKLFDVIDTFIREQIDVAGEAICESVKNKITNGDVILIYSCSSLLYRILTDSHRSGREFSVIVVDGGPWFEGREMLRRLVEAGLKCSYVQISALSFIVRQATKVLIGAHALLANGCVMSRAGSALIALAAHAYSVPVLVCCETYKFCERVQTDAYVYNELGSPDDLVKEDSRLNGWQSLTFLTPLSIVYDITPPDLVTAVVTEIAILPCTSVPVILRVKPSDVVS